MLVGRRPFDFHGCRESEEVALEAGPVALVVTRGTEYARLEPANGVLRREDEGLNFRIEPVTKRLVDAGPAPAAVA